MRRLLRIPTHLSYHDKVNFPDGPPLVVQVTHPRLVYQLGFLVSCVAKRDAVGRKPKRKVFANEGLAAWEREKEQEIVGECRYTQTNVLRYMS